MAGLAFADPVASRLGLQRGRAGEGSEGAASWAGLARVCPFVPSWHCPHWDFMDCVQIPAAGLFLCVREV